MLCVCVCMRVYVCVCMCVYIFIRMYVHMQVRKYIHPHVYNIYMYIPTYLHAYKSMFMYMLLCYLYVVCVFVYM